MLPGHLCTAQMGCELLLLLCLTAEKEPAECSSPWGWLLSACAVSPSLIPLKIPHVPMQHCMGSRFLGCAGCSMELLVQRLEERAVRRGISGWEQAFPAVSQPAQVQMVAVHCTAGRMWGGGYALSLSS